MPPIVFTALQVLFLVLLYAFVARAVRWVIKDVANPGPAMASSQPRAARGRQPKQKRARPRELVIHFPDSAPRVLPLEEGRSVTFGRHQTASVVLTDLYASDFHARIDFDGDGWTLTDEGSTNGTFLNQVRLTAPTPLRAGDQISFGRTTVEVRR
ncbi:FHA-domain-containing protein [Euzebya pacifica]|uniref:FHA-domain-containing protein n=1 Tax=Euzebya pacifica TaxID=1608957 RepID=A0A346XR88_9ACTN|nr:FHA domain-containing protein [Euzebya pacifica]AXV04735.1 FHA-domain-containing protein [Euzebya pacifica]